MTATYLLILFSLTGHPRVVPVADIQECLLRTYVEARFSPLDYNGSLCLPVEDAREV